ncbi:MAG: methyltransferase domain-containing protein [Planctomycetaceae bacterium]|nr:methyltransferase domain-containing protein [Planctomycetaceae bacterium]
MHWHRKAQIQNVLSRIPGGETLYYWLQRYVTKSLPPSDKKFLERFEIEAGHVDTFCRLGNCPVGEAVFFQFGAGWTMSGPLIFHALGVNKQILVDIRRLLRPWLINVSVEQLGRLDVGRKLPRVANQQLSSHVDTAIQQMHDWWGMDYRAPSDARATGLPDNSVDCIATTNTLEHIPAKDIAEIMVECHRILKPGGVISFRVDYQDHYSYFDRSIGVYNFLQYAPTDWRSFNPSLHYQNRLRHCEYLDMYRQAGFDVAEDHAREGSTEDINQLRTLKLHDQFSSMSPEDLAVRYSTVVLKKSVPAVAARAA